MVEGANEHKHILSLKHGLSNYTLLRLARKGESATVAEALLNWYNNLAQAVHWNYDQGRQFENKVKTTHAHTIGAKHTFTTANKPQSECTVRYFEVHAPCSQK